MRTIAVGIGSGVRDAELLQIAMGDSNYVLHVADFKSLKGKLEVILDESCQGMSPALYRFPLFSPRPKYPRGSTLSPVILMLPHLDSSCCVRRIRHEKFAVVRWDGVQSYDSNNFGWFSLEVLPEIFESWF